MTPDLAKAIGAVLRRHAVDGHVSLAGMMRVADAVGPPCGTCAGFGRHIANDRPCDNCAGTGFPGLVPEPTPKPSPGCASCGDFGADGDCGRHDPEPQAAQADRRSGVRTLDLRPRDVVWLGEWTPRLGVPDGERTDRYVLIWPAVDVHPDPIVKRYTVCKDGDAYVGVGTGRLRSVSRPRQPTMEAAQAEIECFIVEAWGRKP